MTTIRYALAAVALLAAASAHAANLDAGKLKAQEVCQACHGMDGQSAASPDYPKIGGQHKDYLAKALRDYKSGARKNAIMAGFAATLSEQDIADLAAFYASQPGALEDLSHLE